MTAPAASLTTITGGISRLRVKGAALKTSLYDLLNGSVTMQGTTKVRPGMIRNSLLSTTTKGLCVYKGAFYTFAHTTVSVPSGVNLRILLDPNDNTQAIAKIWFAKPFLGFLYVAAEFANGDVFHYWLQSTGTWTANTVYFNGNIVVPTTGEVLAYQSQRTLAPNPVWSPQSAITEGQIIEPTVYNGYYFTATTVTGTNPHTGGVEPTWPAIAAATVQEFGDFGTSSTASTISTTSTVQPLSSNITDRYGNSSQISGQTGSFQATSGLLLNGTSVNAQTTVSVWAAGTLYVPGAVVQPSTSQGAFIDAIPNGDFEGGAIDWTFNTPWGISSSGPYQGTQCAEYASSSAFTDDLIMIDPGTVTAGQSVTATGYMQGNANSTVQIKLYWYDVSDTKIGETTGTTVGFASIAPHYQLGTVTGSAPATAVGVRVVFTASTGSTHGVTGRVDLVSWNLETPSAVSNFLYEAIQDVAGTSASTEPTWPTVDGDTVVDGGVTWQAIGSSIITWTATPIMESGGSEPSWPTSPGLSVADGTMSWVCTDRHITDENCPHSKIVVIGASHVFAGDNDIVPYSAAVDPTDWSSSNNAGYLPTGLNDYGDNPVAAMCLYRSNLVVMNAAGYQMWQIDPDPTNMSILDGEPVPCTFPKSVQPANDDLVFLTPVGIRNIGTAGVSGNLQAGNFGKAIDALVLPLMASYSGDPIGLFYPGTGQYMLFFGTQALVLTINGSANQMSWSRFVLPYGITDWAILNEALYVRTHDATVGDTIQQFDIGTLVDDFGTAANPIFSLGAITAGTLYTAGTYNNVALTGGSGTGATANITVASNGHVTAVSIVNPGTGYVGADSLSALAANIGGTGSGFHVPVVNTARFFTSSVWYQYLDLGPIGLEKMMEGFDLACSGVVNVSVGYNQKDFSQVTDPYQVDGDTMDQVGCIPFPVSAVSFQMRFDFLANQDWELEMVNVYALPEGNT